MNAVRWLMTAAAVLIWSLPAHAALGGDVISVTADQTHLRATQTRITQMQSYTLHEMRAESGTMVREYVSPSGQVFGVAWNGPVNPDLKQLLGSYYDKIQIPTQNGVVRRGPVSVKQSGIVFELGGHMRAIAGRAYIPEAVPSGISAEAIH